MPGLGFLRRLCLCLFLTVLLGCESDKCWWEEQLEQERLSVINQMGEYKLQQERLLHLGRPLNPTERTQYWRLEELVRQSRHRIDEINIELAVRTCE